MIDRKPQKSEWNCNQLNQLESTESVNINLSYKTWTLHCPNKPVKEAVNLEGKGGKKRISCEAQMKGEC